MDPQAYPYQSDRAVLLRAPFGDRRDAVRMCFEEADDMQRIFIINDLLARCRPMQLQHLRRWLFARDGIPQLPRRVLLTIFGFLDPVSLCRVSQVCWQWKLIADTDELWRPRCLRHNWHLPYVPSPYEQGAWKAHYADRVAALNRECGIVPSKAASTSRDQRARLAHSGGIAAWRTQSESARDQHLVNRVGVLRMSTDLVLRPRLVPDRSRPLELPDGAPDDALAESLLSLSSARAARTLQQQGNTEFSSDHQHPRVVLLSSDLALPQLLCAAVRADVLFLLYDYQGVTPATLQARLAQLLRGRVARSVAFVCKGCAGRLELADGAWVTPDSLDTSVALRSFWEALGASVMEDEGCIDLFVGGLNHGDSGADLLVSLEQMARRTVRVSSDLDGFSDDLRWLSEGKTCAELLQGRLYFAPARLRDWREAAARCGQACAEASLAVLPLLSKVDEDIADQLAGQVVASTALAHTRRVGAMAASALRGAFTDALTLARQEQHMEQSRQRQLAAEKSGAEYVDPHEEWAGKTRVQEHSGGRSTSEEVVAMRCLARALRHCAVVLDGSREGDETGAGDGASGSTGDQESGAEGRHLLPGFGRARSNGATSPVSSANTTLRSKHTSSSPAFSSSPSQTLRVPGGARSSARSSEATERSTTARSMAMSTSSHYLADTAGLGAAVASSSISAATLAALPSGREAVIGELLRTEIVFLDMLVSAQELLVAPLQTCADLSAANFSIIFGDFRKLVSVHGPFVLNLKERVVAAPEGVVAGDLLAPYAVACQMYVAYARNLQAALATVAACEEKCPTFREYLLHVRGNPRLGLRSLSDILALPLHRPPLLAALAARLFSTSSAEDEDSEAILQSARVFRTTADSVGKIINAAVHVEEAKAVLSSIEGAPVKLPGTRRFVLSQDVVEMVELEPSGGKDEEQYAAVHDLVLHLFSDCIILAQLGVAFVACGQLQRRRQTFLAHVPVKELLVTELEPTLDDHGCAMMLLQLQWDRTRLLLRTPAESSRRRLLDALGALVEKRQAEA